jgi:hypothetical protein
VIRVYRYGLLPPILNVRIVADQMRLVHRYRNVLIDVVTMGARPRIARDDGPDVGVVVIQVVTMGARPRIARDYSRRWNAAWNHSYQLIECVSQPAPRVAASACPRHSGVAG